MYCIKVYICVYIIYFSNFFWCILKINKKNVFLLITYIVCGISNNLSKVLEIFCHRYYNGQGQFIAATGDCTQSIPECLVLLPPARPAGAASPGLALYRYGYMYLYIFKEMSYSHLCVYICIFIVVHLIIFYYSCTDKCKNAHYHNFKLMCLPSQYRNPATVVGSTATRAVSVFIVLKLFNSCKMCFLIWPMLNPLLVEFILRYDFHDEITSFV